MAESEAKTTNPQSSILGTESEWEDGNETDSLDGSVTDWEIQKLKEKVSIIIPMCDYWSFEQFKEAIYYIEPVMSSSLMTESCSWKFELDRKMLIEAACRLIHPEAAFWENSSNSYSTCTEICKLYGICDDEDIVLGRDSTQQYRFWNMLISDAISCKESPKCYLGSNSAVIRVILEICLQDMTLKNIENAEKPIPISMETLQNLRKLLLEESLNCPRDMKDEDKKKSSFENKLEDLNCLVNKLISTKFESFHELFSPSKRNDDISDFITKLKSCTETLKILDDIAHLVVHMD